MFEEAFEVNSKTPDLLVIDFVVSIWSELLAFSSIIELFVFLTISFALSDIEDPIIILPLMSKLPAPFVLMFNYFLCLIIFYVFIFFN